MNNGIESIACSEKSNCFHFVNKRKSKSKNDDSVPSVTTDCSVQCSRNSGLTNVTLCCAVTEDSKTKGKFQYVGKSKIRLDSYQKLDNLEITMRNHEGTSVSTEQLKESDENKSAHEFIRSAFLISANVSLRNEEKSESEVQRPKRVKPKVKRSKSTSSLFRKRSYDDFSSDDSSDSFNSSLESLIKHNLQHSSTSKALQPVPVSVAKERNFLHGRSGLESVLGRNELDRIFPNHEVTIFIGTWNMNGEEPPTNLNELFLNETMENLPDIYVLGTQESFSETSEWEVCIQETIGPTHVLFHSETLGTIFLGVYIRRELIWFCSLPEDDSHSVRPGSSFKTKGAVGICFYLFGSSFLFISSHLTAHDDKLHERICDVERIMKSLDLPKQLPVSRRPIHSRTPNVVHNFDYVFWFGDLNFRLTQPREQVIDWVAKQKFPLDPNLPCPFYDQLNSSMKKGLVFRGFQEAPITFPPTYKYDPGTSNFDTSHKKRIPSYTDRILFKSRKSAKSLLTPLMNYTSVKCLTYNSVPSFCTSDHKPVWGVYTCKIRPGMDNMPLAAGWFKREVYLDALKRRAAHRHSRYSGLDDARPCSIQ